MTDRFVLAASLALVTVTGLCAQESAPSNTSIWLPAQPWALELDAPGFTVEKNVIQPDGRRYFLAENKGTKMVASVYLEAMSGTQTAGEFQRSLHDKESRFSALGLTDVA